MAAMLVSGPGRRNSVILDKVDTLVRFSSSYFMRANAAGSAAGTSASRSCSFFLACVDVGAQWIIAHDFLQCSDGEGTLARAHTQVRVRFFP